jgi:hypothetical protein
VSLPSRFDSRQSNRQVPDLTGSADIKLNQRVLLRRHPRSLWLLNRTISPKRPGPTVAKPSGDHIPLGGFVSFEVACMIFGSQQPRGAWAEVWHLWTVIIPRRSITGRLVYGRVWRRHDGRHWIYKKFFEYDKLIDWSIAFGPRLIGYLPLRTRASFCRSAVNAMPAPMIISARVALRLPGAMQLIQVPMIVGASYTVLTFPK